MAMRFLKMRLAVSKTKMGITVGSTGADLQLLESSSSIVQWLRESPPQDLSAFRHFYQAYYDEKKKLTSSPIRAALSHIFPMDKKGTDPFDLLAFILDLSPMELKGIVRKTIFYNKPLNGVEVDQEIEEGGDSSAQPSDQRNRSSFRKNALCISK